MEISDVLSPAGKTKMGVCQFLLGKFKDALETLQSADGSAMAFFLPGALSVRAWSYEDAIGVYGQAQTSGYNEDQCKIGIAEAHRYAGRIEEALAILDNIFGPAEQTADYMYQRAATVAAVGGRMEEAIALATNGPCKPTKTTPARCSAWHSKTIAWATTKSALNLYERAAKAISDRNWSALINLGLIYEDNGQLRQSADVLQAHSGLLHPDHPQTLLYMKDASATGNMLYDEEAQRRNDRLAQTLNMPVTNFELSVRSRNCLQKMGIDTIGDLTRTTRS